MLPCAQPARFELPLFDKPWCDEQHVVWINLRVGLSKIEHVIRVSLVKLFLAMDNQQVVDELHVEA